MTDEITTRRPVNLIQSVTRALDILAAVGGSTDGLTRADIAETCGINQHTSYHLINTLAYGGYVTRLGGRWILGPAITDRAAERAQQPHDAPRQARG